MAIHYGLCAFARRFSPRNSRSMLRQCAIQKTAKYATGNLFPKPERFPVKKGDIIGYTGDTGGSGGPHLTL